MYFVEQEYFTEYSSILKNYFILQYKKRQNYVDMAADPDKTAYAAKKTTLYDTNLDNFMTQDDHLPLVVLIGGYAGSGKSTFINFCSKYLKGVLEKSSINPCKAVVRYMGELETYYPNCGSVVEEIDRKSDKYRTLLSKLKSLWCEFDDGPNELIIHDLKATYEDTSNTSVCFINVREPSQIEHLKKRLEEELNCIVLTLCVIRDDLDEVSNDSDNSTMNYCYDLSILNTDSLRHLLLLSNEFCHTVVDVNYFAKKLKLHFQELSL